MNNFKAKTFFRFLIYSVYRPHRKGHGIHSPFLYSYVTSVLKYRKNTTEITAICKLRKTLLRDKAMIQTDDFGAGSVRFNKQGRSIQSIARHSLSSKKYGILLHHTVAYFQPETILELGACLGIGTMYLATANRSANVITIEGSNALLQKAVANFDAMNLHNITAVQGNFNDVLPKVLKNHEGFDLIYIDGNHRKDATITYFQSLLPHLKSNSVIIFDDIRWSAEMLEAWQMIIQHEKVRQSVDLFWMGIVFCNEKLLKQHFQIYY